MSLVATSNHDMPKNQSGNFQAQPAVRLSGPAEQIPPEAHYPSSVQYSSQSLKKSLVFCDSSTI